RADGSFAGLDPGAVFGQRLLGDDRHDALSRRAAMLHAGDDLLADVATLCEARPVQLVEERLVREGVAERIVPSALRHAEADAVGMIVGLFGVELDRSLSTADQQPEAEGGQAGIG